MHSRSGICDFCGQYNPIHSVHTVYSSRVLMYSQKSGFREHTHTTRYLEIREHLACVCTTCKVKAVRRSRIAFSIGVLILVWLMAAIIGGTIANLETMTMRESAPFTIFALSFSLVLGGVCASSLYKWASIEHRLARKFAKERKNRDDPKGKFKGFTYKEIDRRFPKSAKTACKCCGQVATSSNTVCSHCGRVDWGAIIICIVTCLIFVAIGVYICNPGFWRWFWIVIGVIIGAGAVGMLIEAKKRSQTLPQASSALESITADDLWEKAIITADDGQDSAAVAYFKRAIEANPDYYISVIQPASPRAKACWELAVDGYIKHKQAQAFNNSVTDNNCVVCGKNFGLQWHYYFESLSLGKTIGAKCPECNRTVCMDHIEYGPDGKYPPNPCPDCGGKILELQEGPATSSMVEKARSERRYRGAIKEPAKTDRSVVQG